MIGQASGAATEYASYNTFVGSYAGWDNNRTNNTTNANRNTYVGYYCGFSNRDGEDNVGMGASADYGNTVRSRNTFFGSSAYVNNNDVVAIGYDTYNTGQYGISLGSSSDVRGKYSIGAGYGTYITSGSDSVVSIGALSYISADNAISIGQADSVTALSGIAIGYQAASKATGAMSFGYKAKVSNTYAIGIGYNSSVSGSNSIAIGYGSTVTADNEVYIGNSSTTSIGGIVNWTATSDGRFKTNVQENVSGLDFITKLRPVTYNINPDAYEKFYGKVIPADMVTTAENKKAIQYTGFIAQEVEKAANSCGYDFSGVDKPQSDKDAYGIRYAEFVVPLVKATQELNAKIEEQERIIKQQQQLLQVYEASLQSLEQRVLSIENGSMSATAGTGN